MEKLNSQRPWSVENKEETHPRHGSGGRWHPGMWQGTDGCPRQQCKGETDNRLWNAFYAKRSTDFGHPKCHLHSSLYLNTRGRCFTVRCSHFTSPFTSRSSKLLHVLLMSSLTSLPNWDGIPTSARKHKQSKGMSPPFHPLTAVPPITYILNTVRGIPPEMETPFPLEMAIGFHHTFKLRFSFLKSC